VHGHMPSVATGASMANKNLSIIGVSGDGDTASIGMGQFIHAMRRNVDMVYIVENNGVYGLTKGQFSATSDKGARVKTGEVNPYAYIDLCQLALDMGCGFVARSFSGDSHQMVSLIRAGFHHKGFALIDAISPCVTFNNLPDSTRGYTWLKANNISLHEVDFVAPYAAVEVDYEPGTTHRVPMPDGGSIVLHKLAEQEHDPTDRPAAVRQLELDRTDDAHVFTGLIYYDTSAEPLDEVKRLGSKPLAAMDENDLRPGRDRFSEILDAYC
jgi:2-oxoglutarate ferredoxin oxidoreductase subunit beta